MPPAGNSKLSQVSRQKSSMAVFQTFSWGGWSLHRHLSGETEIIETAWFSAAVTHNSQCPAAAVTNLPSADNWQLVEEEAPCARAVRPSVADGH